MSWKTCLRSYTNEIVFLLLSLTEFIQLAINISISYMAKKPIKSGKGRTSYIYFQTSGIYTFITENNCSKNGTDCWNLGAHATKQNIYVQIGAKSNNYCKIIYSVKVKMCQLICNAQIHTHIYLNTLRDVLGRVWRQVDSSEKKLGVRVNHMSVLLLWLPPLWL